MINYDKKNSKFNLVLMKSKLFANKMIKMYPCYNNKFYLKIEK